MDSGRVYFNTKMLDDALLKSYVTPEIVKESSRYIEALAISMGVAVISIADPVPYMISRLAMLFAYMTAAHRKATFSTGKEADNDSYALKYKMYKELLDDTLSQITADTFTNGVTAKKRKFPATMSLARN